MLPGTSVEIQVEMEQRRRRDQKKQTKEDLQLALRRRLNRNLKDRQLLLHKTSLLCHFGRAHYYNRLLNDTEIMQKVLPVLPSQNAYPPKSGTEIKYFISFTTWFKTTFKLAEPRMYPEHPRKKLKRKYLRQHLLDQIKQKKACCKQDMIFIYVVLLRAMGLQCRLVCNFQPLPMKPAASDLLSLKLNNDDDAQDNKEKATSKNAVKKETSSSENLSKSSSQKVTRVVAGGVADVGEEEEQELVKKPKPEKKYALRLEKLKISTRSKQKKEIIEKEEEAEAQQLEVEETEKMDTEEIKDNTQESESEIVVQKSSSAPQATVKRSTRSKQKKEIIEKEEEAEAQQLEVEEIEKMDTEEIKDNTQESESEIVVQKSSSAPQATAKRSTRSKQKKEIIEKEEEAETQQLEVDEIEKMDTEEIKENAQESESEIVVQKKSSAPPATAKRSTRSKQKKEIIEKEEEAETQQLEIKETEKCVENTNENHQETDMIVQKRSSARSKTILKDQQNTNIPAIIEPEAADKPTRNLRRLPARRASPKLHISSKFMQTNSKVSPEPKFAHLDAKVKPTASDVKIKLDLGENAARVLRQRNKKAAAETLKIPQLDGADDDLEQIKEHKSRGKRLQLKKINKTRSKEESDDDFQVSPPKKAKAPKPDKKSPRAILSTDEEYAGDTKSPKKKSRATDIWVEAWCDMEEQWVCIDIFTVKVHAVEAIRKAASSNLAYVYAFQNDLSIKDVTARYCLNWGSVVRKSRVDGNWLSTALAKTQARKTKRDVAEDQQLRRIHEEKPLPTTISEYKNHPLYALERHLLKFQAIYPPNAPTLGFVRNEPVYARECVHTLHSREIWHRMARVVKLGEKAYKVVKSRPKWDRHAQKIITDVPPLDIFGYWQTKQFEPPVAENGRVPRNEYGNVELFKECMLPINTVHLRLPGLQRVCKKLGIDCANAVVGFDFHQGACHPEYDGFIVCEEFKDTVIEAWEDDQRIQEEKEREKYEARVYGNWKKLIKGLFIRERLKTKYNY